MSYALGCLYHFSLQSSTCQQGDETLQWKIHSPISIIWLCPFGGNLRLNEANCGLIWLHVAPGSCAIQKLLREKVHQFTS